ncbi:MAG TPA: PP0621 family protein, partial [Burkholderiaceae bacterium]
IVIVVAVLISMLRGSLSRRRRDDGPRPPSGAAPQAMLSCAQCGVHLPRDEALPGRGGVFCSAAHRAAYEQGHSRS